MCIPEFNTLADFVAFLVILTVSFFLHSILFHHGRMYQAEKAEIKRVHKRMLYLAIAVAATLLAMQIGNGCERVEFKAWLLMLVGLVIWEVVFFLCFPPERMYGKPTTEKRK